MYLEKDPEPYSRPWPAMCTLLYMIVFIGLLLYTRYCEVLGQRSERQDSPRNETCTDEPVICPEFYRLLPAAQLQPLTLAGASWRQLLQKMKLRLIRASLISQNNPCKEFWCDCIEDDHHISV